MYSKPGLACALFLAAAPPAVSVPPPEFPPWDGGAVPNRADLPRLDGVAFHVITPYEFGRDGYRFLHGVALAWHQGRLYVGYSNGGGGVGRQGEGRELWNNNSAELAIIPVAALAVAP